MTEATALVNRARWPRWLDAGASAEYVGVSRSHYLAEVAAGTWPPPVRRSIRVVLWDRLALDQTSDRMSKGIASLSGDDLMRKMAEWRG